MFKFPRTLAPSRKSIFRPPRSVLRHNGQITIQRVRFVRPIFTRKRARNLFLSAVFIGTVFVFSDFSDDEDEQQRDAGSMVKNIAQEAREKHQKATGRFEKVSPEEDQKGAIARREGVSGNGGGSDQDKAEGENGIPENVRDKKEQEEGEDGYEEEEREHGYEEEGEDEDDDEDEEEEDEEDEGEEDSVPQPVPENALFIPLGFVRERRRSYYKGSSPEWQSFLDLTMEPNRVDSIRYELANLVGVQAANIRWFRKKIGVPLMVNAFWLDIEFPDRPPPVYERRGLEITGDYVALTTRPVSAWQYSRLKTILWPTPMAASLWKSYWTLWSLRFAKFKEYLNIKSKKADMHPNPSRNLLDFRGITNRKQESPPSPRVDRSESESSKDDPAGERLKSSAKRVSSNVTGALPPLPTLPEPGEDMKIAHKTFRRTLLRNWRGPEIPEEPGTCLVTGTVKVVGSKAICWLDVRASYHPRDSRWINVGVNVRRIQDNMQKPKR